MNRIIRWYNQNKRIIWIATLTIIGVISLIQVLNNYYKNNTKEESSSTNISTTTSNKNDYSVVTQEKIDTQTANQSNELIKQFIDYCNNKELEKAYEMLSIQCKEELYSTIEEFINNYYNRIFSEKKSYDSTLWISTAIANTYRVEIMADLLATGKKENMPIEEYYTIVNEKGSYKLNINRYINKNDINISKEQNGINVSIISKHSYLDYEKYEIKVENNTGKKLIFNTKENTNSMYLQDENELKYIAFLNEIPNNEFEVIPGTSKVFKIKFNRGYKPNINIEKIVFEDIQIGDSVEKEKIDIALK